MKRIFLVFSIFLAMPVWAENILPERRLVYSRDTDFYGGDLAPIFDSTIEACARVCLADDECVAMTFNSRSNACFPKSSIDSQEAYEGATSARVVTMPNVVLRLAEERRSAFDALQEGDLENAARMTLEGGQKFIGGNWSVEVLRQAVIDRETDNRIRDAYYWARATVAQSDLSSDWLEVARLANALGQSEKNYGRKTGYRNDAVGASVNAYLRADSNDTQIAALQALATNYEVVGRGRDMIPALRLAQSIERRASTASALSDAISKYGFRVTDTLAENNAADPRICVYFSEELNPRQDYTPFVRLDGAEAALSVQDRKLCVSGVSHGQRYEVSLREGLPALSGEELLFDVVQSQYMRDRAPSARFAGRAYVLPRSSDAAVPVITVNTDRLEVTLNRVDDRNILRAIQRGFFGRAIDRYDADFVDGSLGAEIWQGSVEIETRLNADVSTGLPVAEILQDQPPGLFALTVWPDMPQAQRATQWFVLSDIGLSTLKGSDGITVLASDLVSAASMEGVTIELLSQTNAVLARAETDAAGRVTFPAGLSRGTGGNAPAMIVARHEADLAFLSLTDAAFDLSDRGVEGRAASGPVDVYLTTDRGAYRAGEVIHATALVRDAGAKALDNVPLTVILKRPDGVEAWQDFSRRSSAGGHDFAIPTQTAAPRGTWTLEIFSDPDAPALARQQILIEDFVPERIDVALTLPEGPLAQRGRARLSAQVDYLFGAPGADLPVEARVRVSRASEIDGWAGYSFGRHDERIDAQTRYADLVRTNASGRADVALALPRIETFGVPLKAEIFASASDGAARPVERKLTRPVASRAPLLGLKPDFDGVAPEGGDVRFSVVSLLAGAPAAMALEWELNRLTTDYEWYESYGEWTWESSVTRERIDAGEITTASTPQSFSTAVDWGEYEIVLRATDGSYSETSMTFWAGWYAPVSSGAAPDMLDVALNQDRFAIGDTAEVIVDARYAGTARIAVLSDRLISMETIAIAEGENRHRLAVTEHWAPGAYVTVQLLTGQDAGAFVPTRALGLAHAQIDPGPRALDVRLVAPEEMRPNSTLAAAIEIAGLGANTKAYVSLAATDVGILNLTGHDAPDPSGHYFGKRHLGVEMRDLYGRLIDAGAGQLGRMRQGGDGAAGLSLDAPPPTEKLVAFASGIVETDAEGRARFDFDIPDFNGSVRLAAMAWTEEGVGQASAEVLVRDPVVMTLAMPRFLAPGDTARLRLDLTHVAGAAGEMPLRIEAPGLASTLESQVALDENGRSSAILTLAPQDVGDFGIRAVLTLPNGEELIKTATLGVRANDPKVSRVQRLSLAPGETLSLDDGVFAGLRFGGAELMLSAGPMAHFNMPRALSDLTRYPYGCTEQLTSQALPLLYLSDLSTRLGLQEERAIVAQVRGAIDTILTRQSGNGSFGLWRADRGEFWLDAYVTDFLSQARTAGYSVPERAFETALDNLSNRVNANTNFEQGNEDIAYALMVLAREGRAAMSDLRYFADVQSEAILSPFAAAQLGTALSLYGDTRRSARMFSQASALLDQGGDPRTGRRSDFGTPLRDVAGVLTLASMTQTSAMDPSPALAQIADAQGQSHLSTQEQAWLLLAAHEARDALAGASLTVDGTQLSQAAAARFGPGDAPRQITNTSQSEMPLVLSAIGAQDGATDAGGTAYRISRQYYTLDGAEHSGDFILGERYVTVLSVISSVKSGARLMVDDALPAGLEIDNPSLLQSGDVSALPWLKPAYAEHSEFRTDRFLGAVTRSDDETFSLAYIVRAVTPGEFHHPAALVEDMYRPTNRGQTASGRIRVIQ